MAMPLQKMEKLQKALAELIQKGKGEAIRRISARQTLYRVELGDETYFPVYSRKQKKVYQIFPNARGYQLGDMVSWQTTNGRKYRGKIVFVVPTGKQAENVVIDKRYNIRPITNMSPRGQESYLVSVRQGEDFTLYWPPTSRLRREDERK